jgi:hypothetical protein
VALPIKGYKRVSPPLGFPPTFSLYSRVIGRSQLIQLITHTDMSGLEALGVACMVMQVITFARDAASVCVAVYKGQATPDATFEENSVTISEWATKLGIQTNVFGPEERDLEQLVKSCQTAASNLATEMQKITKYHKKSDLLSAMRASAGSIRHRRKIEDLDRSLSSYMDSLQTIMTQKAYFRTKAIEVKQQDSFTRMESSLQHFISKVAAGHTEIQDLVAKEHISSRQHNTREIENATTLLQNHMSYTASQQKAGEVIKRQHERLLGSLKSPTMRKRHNEIMEPANAHFSRIFKAFNEGTLRLLNQGENVSNGSAMSSDIDNLNQSERSDSDSDWESISSSSSSSLLDQIDSTWQSFLEWLLSEAKVYWISGIPGSGKSTLIKFIVHHEQTMKLLRLWRSEIMILSYFFWRIGSPTQNSLKGLLTSLLYQILEENSSIVEGLVDSPELTRIEFYDDWSLSELKRAISSAINLQPKSLCIFIDGLDEFLDPDGPEPLLQTLRWLGKNYKVKLCVSSRPEPQLHNRLHQFPNLRLQDLTRPEMQDFVERRFSDFKITGELRKDLSDALLDKAQGSFLWVHLALRSLVNGIRNGDNENFLEERLRTMPGELNDLYADMWKRLNGDELIYRTRAARHFMFMIVWKELKPDSNQNWYLLEMMYAHELASGNCSLEETKHYPHTAVPEMCRKLRKDVSIQSAGLLEVIPSKRATSETNYYVKFIHRTAYDFLVDTEQGQKILSYANFTMDQAQFQVIKACLASNVSPHNIVFRNMVAIIPKLKCPTTISEWMVKEFDLILQTAERFDEGERFVRSEYLERLPHRSLLSQILENSHLDEFFAPLIEKLSPADATEVLRDGWDSGGYRGISAKSTWRLLSAGADPNLPAFSIDYYYSGQPFRLAEQHTALWDCLLHINSFGEPEKEFDDVIAAMAKNCNLDQRKFLVWATHTDQLFLHCAEGFDSDRGDWDGMVAYIEVNLQFLMQRNGDSTRPSLTVSDESDNGQSLQQAKIVQPFATVKFVHSPRQPDNPASSKSYYLQIPESHPIQDLFREFCGFIGSSDFKSFFDTLRRCYAGLETLCERPDPGLIQMDNESFARELCKEGSGFCTLEDSGIIVPSWYDP